MASVSIFARVLSTKKIIIPFVLIVLYAVFGFFIAPPVIKSTLLSNITEHLGRNAGVEEIKVNPFALSLTVRDFKMNEPDGEVFVGFGELYVNFQLSSIFRRAYTFDEIRLLEPEGQVKILPDGNVNFTDLLPSQEQQAQPKQAPGQDSEPVPVLVFKLEIDNGRFTFRDLERPTPFEAVFFPIRFTLDNFSTQKDNKNPYAFTATTGKGESLSWEGSFSVNPFRSKGRFALTGIKERRLWEYIRHQVRFEVTGGSMDLAARYSMDAGSDAFQFELIDGELEIRDFGVAEKGTDHSLISVPFVAVQGFDMDLSKKQISVASVKSSDARIESWLDPDGTFNFQTLFSMEDSSEKDDSSSKAPDHIEVESPPWQISISELTLDNYGVALENRTLAKPLRIKLEPITLNLKNLSNQKDSQVEVGLAFNVDKTGMVKVDGQACIDPLSADLAVDVAQLDLKPLQSYVDSVAQLALVNGTANLKGDVKYGRAGDEGPELGFRGKVSVNDFQIKDQLHSEDFVNWGEVAVNGISFDVAPNKLSISEIVARELYARVVIWPDSTVNVSDAFSSREAVPADDAVYVVERPVSAVKSKGEGPMPITIDAIRIENGSVNFTDMSLKPGFATGIQNLNGTVKGLTSESLGRADVMLEGKTGQYAPVKIFGQINPLSEDAYTDLTMSFKNIELATATPYSGKFVGYTIEKGKLSLDLKYKLSENLLIGENKVVLDQFTFGGRTDSPTATKLPVKLAVALLKDRNGIIDLDLPVRGDLNDPEFSYGRAILKTLMNLITKIVTSPFTALGKVVGIDGEDLSYVAFEFGSAALQPSQNAKLDKLAKALKDRPTLQLGIKGIADAQYDRLALSEKELLHQLKIVKSEEMQAAGMPVPADIEELSISDDEYSRILIEAYKARFEELPRVSPEGGPHSEEADGKVAPVLIAGAKQRLVKSMPVDESALQELARKRAMVIKEYLVQQAGIQDQQVLLADIEISDSSGDDNIRTDLTLSGT